MTGDSYITLLADIRSRRAQVVERVCQLVAVSKIRIPGDTGAAELAHYAGALVDSLEAALGGLAPGEHVAPGSPDAREVERTTAFVGANLATTASYAYDVAALVLAVRDAMLDYLGPAEQRAFTHLFEWLVLVGMESYGSAALAGQREATCEQLERGMPVVLITPEVPAVFLIGEGGGLVLENVFGKLLLAVARVGARAVIIDVTGFADPTVEPMLAAVSGFLGHRKIGGTVHLMAVGLDVEGEQAWSELADATTLSFPRSFDAALVHALDRCGRRIVGSPGSL